MIFSVFFTSFVFVGVDVDDAQTERDVSVRQRAVDLLYAMCDKSNAEEIVQEMLNYLETADYSIREEMVRNDAIFFAHVHPLGRKGKRSNAWETSVKVAFDKVKPSKT